MERREGGNGEKLTAERCEKEVWIPERNIDGGRNPEADGKNKYAIGVFVIFSFFALSAVMKTQCR